MTTIDSYIHADNQFKIDLTLFSPNERLMMANKLLDRAEEILAAWMLQIANLSLDDLDDYLNN